MINHTTREILSGLCKISTVAALLAATAAAQTTTTAGHQRRDPNDYPGRTRNGDLYRGKHHRAQDVDRRTQSSHRTR
jgi:hypothetical protein